MEFLQAHDRWRAHRYLQLSAYIKASESGIRAEKEIEKHLHEKSRECTGKFVSCIRGN